jgi:hypothetical protein
MSFAELVEQGKIKVVRFSNDPDTPQPNPSQE